MKIVTGLTGREGSAPSLWTCLKKEEQPLPSLRPPIFRERRTPQGRDEGVEEPQRHIFES